MAELWTPCAHQKTGIKWLIQHPVAALFWDPGLMKTTTTLAAFTYLQRAKGARKALVVAPRRVCYEVWSQTGEIGKWSNFEHLKVSLLHGGNKDDALDEDADLYVINPDGLKWLIDGGGLKRLLKAGVDTLIVDELSKFKHSSSKRFKLLRPHLGRFKRRWGLTGSPSSNGLLDLFGQVYVLDLGVRLGRYITHYRHAHFVPSGYKGYVWTLQDGAEKIIYKKLKDLALSMRAADHLDLPPLLERDVWISLPTDARRIYDELEDELVADLEHERVTAANAAVASGKCRQVASGGLYAETKIDPRDPPAKYIPARRVLKVHDEKTEALADLVEELQGAPLLVAYQFDHDLARIRESLGDLPAINGKTLDSELGGIVRRWNGGEIPVLCGHPAAMGHGLNLQGAGSHVCWYSPPWDLELYDQTNRRVYRAGVKGSRVVIHRILARGTVDVDVALVLGSKKRTQDALLDALKARVRARARHK